MSFTKITSDGIGDNAVTSTKIAAGAVTAADIPDGEITSAKLSTALQNTISGKADTSTVNAALALRVTFNSSTGAANIPSGTTAQRPASPVAGMVRHNTDFDEPEWYDDINGTWRAFSEKSYSGYFADILIVAGGGASGGSWSTGGGGGGGVVEREMLLNPATSYRVIIGAGATPNITGAGTWGNQGNDSIFQDIIAVGGGGGGGWQFDGSRGGSGGGGSSNIGNIAGHPVYGQGFSGGTGTNNGANYAGGGGGGARGNGNNAPDVNTGGRGGPGHPSRIDGNLFFYGAGGSGGSNSGAESTANGSTARGQSGGANTGAGGGGNNGGTNGNKGNGGSGIVIVRYVGSQRGTGGDVVVTTSIENVTYTVHIFTSSGTYTA